MRSRSNSGVRLDLYYRIANQTILKYQNPVTGLIANSKENNDVWVRDNVYSISSVWALALAYRKTADADEDRAKAYELEQSVVKLMRGLMVCMLRQVDKVELFKHSQSPKHCLHAKYSSVDCSTVASDSGWGHLQIDATSIYLLMLAQMTASGLQIVHTLDEVAFIQNLIFYIESAYRIPDYGIWERGDKTNHGLPELNASSIGMAKAAMEAMSGLDLFGSNGSSLSTIQVQADKIAQCDAILQSLLPRESNSKEVDSALLSVIGFPAFAVDDQELIDLTRETILSKCLGRYGCCRFLRDGYKTAVEDPHRLHYEPWELQKFENIECEWPIFLAYLSINESFDGNKDKASDYLLKLSKLLVQSPNGVKVVPEMYAVPADSVKKEWSEPGSQDRVPVGQIPHKWGQSLYILGRLLSEGFISPSELDPLNRRLTVLPKPDLVVQLVMLAENDMIRDCLAEANLRCHTVSSLQEDGKFTLHQAKVLRDTLSHLGQNEKLGLTGRCDGVGLLASSTLYRYGDNIYCFTPELYDHAAFYLAMDQDFVFDQIRTDLQYLKANWQMLGRPTMILPVYKWMSDFSGDVPYEFKRAIKMMQSGYYGGVRVQLGDIDSFLSTSCVTSLEWLRDSHAGQDCKVLNLLKPTRASYPRLRLGSGGRDILYKSTGLNECAPQIQGIIKRGLALPVCDSHSHRAGHLHLANSANYLPLNVPGTGSCGDFSNFSRQNSSELVDLLLTTNDPTEQADLIHYLYVTRGPEYSVQLSEGSSCTITDLLEELYHKAGSLKIWWLVRYSAGMLRKRVFSLATALSDLLVRQKQVTLGLPSHKEYVISQPLTPEDVALKIESVCDTEGLHQTDQQEEPYKAISPHCMLHQELLIYMAMFARTEPRLFHEMLRVRIGLIIAVMTTELSRCLDCSGEEATSHLLNLSPYELKNLLHHILSGKEFVVQEVEESHLTILSQSKADSVRTPKTKSVKHKIFSPSVSRVDICREMLDADEEYVCGDNSGQWGRRRRIDGALNRAPVGFYSKIWHVLEQCQGISIEGKVLSQNLIKEMTEGELKFALKVEAVLNQIPEPEYRQLIVEALITLTLFSQMNRANHFVDKIIPVNDIITKAYIIYLRDQNISEKGLHISGEERHQCHRLRGICEEFYDTAPSGSYGTITYMCRALPEVIDIPTIEGDDTTQCSIQ